MNSIIRRRGIAAAVTLAVSIAALAGCSPAATPATDETPAASTGDLELITPGVLRVGLVPGAKPFIFQDEKGEWQGFEKDLVTNVAQRAGINKIEWVQQEFSTILANTANGVYDIAASCFGITAPRRETLDFVKDYNNGYLIFIAKKDAGITGAADLSGKRVGLVTGTVEDVYMQEEVPDGEIVGFPDNNAAVAALLAGAVDTVFLDTDPAGVYVDENPELAEAFKVTSTAPCAWPISYDKPNLKAALDKGMEDAIADGTVAQLTKQWLPDSPLLPEYSPKS